MSDLLVNAYKGLLESLSVFENNEQQLVVRWTNAATGELSEAPVLINSNTPTGNLSRAVCLPYEHVLNSPENGLIKFSPMSENIFRGQSEVFNKLLMLTAARCGHLINQNVGGLTTMVLDRANHANLNAGGMELLTKIEKPKSPKTDELIWKYIAKILNTCTGLTGTKPLLRFKAARYVNEGKPLPEGMVTSGSSAVLRTVSVTSNIFKTEFPYDVKPPRENVGRTVVDIFKTIYGDFIDKTTIVLAGSGHKAAPYFFAYLNAYAEMITRLDGIQKTLMENGYIKPENYCDFKVDSWYFDEKFYAELHASEINIAFEGNTGLVGNEPEDAINTSQQYDPTAISLPQLEASGAPTEHVIEVTVENTHLVKHPLTGRMVKPEMLPNNITHRKPMNTNDLYNQAATATETSGASVFAKIAAKKQQVQGSQAASPVHVNQTAAPQPTQYANQPAQQAVSGAPVIAPRRQHVEQASSASATPIVAVKPAAQRLVQLHDCYGIPLMLQNGQPYLVPANAVPNFPFEVEMNQYNQPIWNKDGTPSLIEAVVQNNHVQYAPPARHGYQNQSNQPLSHAERARALIAGNSNNTGYQPAQAPSARAGASVQAPQYQQNNGYAQTNQGYNQTRRVPVPQQQQQPQYSYAQNSNYNHTV